MLFRTILECVFLPPLAAIYAGLAVWSFRVVHKERLAGRLMSGWQWLYPLLSAAAAPCIVLMLVYGLTRHIVIIHSLIPIVLVINWPIIILMRRYPLPSEADSASADDPKTPR